MIVRKESKGHGTDDYIEGPLPDKGSKVTVLEDVVTTGASSIKAVKRLRDAGYEVKRVVSIIDRQENEEANTAFKLAGLEFYSLFSLEEIANETNVETEHQIKSNKYYLFWGAATFAVMAGQIYVGAGYRTMSQEVRDLAEIITIKIELEELKFGMGELIYK